MKKLLIPLLLTLLAACQSSPSEADQKAALEEKVLYIHDEAMAKMGQVFRLRKKLSALRDTLETQQTDTATARLLQRELAGLSAADAAMMDWMHQYNAPDTMQHAAAMAYLEQELKKIEKVNTTMDSTIAAAQKTQKQHEPNQ